MSLAPYHLRLRQHLSRYKRDVLGVLEDGTWAYRGRVLSYGHILPEDRRELNIVEGVREEFWSYWEHQRNAEPHPARLHRYFAHLTSSQALAFNVFFPFLESPLASPEPLLQALGLEPEGVARWRFEHVLEHAEQTNFDVSLTLRSGRRVMVEVKLGERGFGSCTDEPKYRDKLTRIYMPALVGKVAESALEPDTFFKHYQILRNVSYASANTRVVFLVPRANEALRSDIAFIETAVAEPYRSAVSCVCLEDLLASLSSSTAGSPLASIVMSVDEKYAI